MKITIAAVGCVAATAVVGTVAADPESAWYQNLRKPTWQPAPAVYGLVWTPLYAAIAYSGVRALRRAEGRARGRLARGFLVDLALNAAWTPLFFRARRPRLALAEIACLDIANVLLIRRAWQADRGAAALLLPYATWTVIATALNAEIVRLNAGAP
jgi:translocator protein